MEVGSKPWRRRRDRRRGLSRLKPTFGEGRIRSRSILCRYQLCNCARRRRGSGGPGWGCGGGISKDLTWKGQWRCRLSRTRMVWSNKGEEGGG